MKRSIKGRLHGFISRPRSVDLSFGLESWLLTNLTVGVGSRVHREQNGGFKHCVCYIAESDFKSSSVASFVSVASMWSAFGWFVCFGHRNNAERKVNVTSCSGKMTGSYCSFLVESDPFVSRGEYDLARNY